MFDLTGRVALVTGGGPVGAGDEPVPRGAGSGIAMALAAQGAAVVVNDINADRAALTAEAIAERGGTAVAAPFDIQDHEQATAAIEGARQQFGHLDILVNSVGVPAGYRDVPFEETGPDEWRPYFELNAFGLFNCVSAVLPGMRAQHYGRIVVITSVAGVVGLPRPVTVYGASKAAQGGFVRNLALEAAPHGITVNSLALGKMNNKVADTDDHKAIVAGIPVGRMGTPADVGAAAVFLASEEAGWLTGQVIGLHGGAFAT